MKKIQKVYPFLYGIFGSLGLLCYANVFCVLYYKISEHPYAHPFCVVAGSLSLIICLAVFCMDIVSLMGEEKKLRRLLTEFLITLVSFVGFIFIWSGLWKFVSNFIMYWEW